MSDDWRPAWIERERATARLVKACWKDIADGDPTAEQLEGVIRLTWITKSKSRDPNETWLIVADHVSARTTTWRGLEQVFGVRLPTSRDTLFTSHELERAGVPPEVAVSASVPVGFSHFYRAFRSARLTEWLEANRRTVVELFRAAGTWDQDNAGRLAAGRTIEALPKLMRGNGKDGVGAGNFLTPVLAFLDALHRFPIVNARHPDVMAKLGLGRRSFAGIVEALLTLVPWPEAGITDAMDLDWWAGWDDDVWAGMAVSRVRGTGAG